MFEERCFALIGMLERIAKILTGGGIPFELIGGGAVQVHVKVRLNQAAQNPPLGPEHFTVLGLEVAVIALVDLVQMKLCSNRAIDQVHIQDLASA